MFYILKNEKGSAMAMAAAIVVALVTVASAWGLLSMVADAELLTHLDHDAIQQELFLRSESIRTHLSIEHNSFAVPPARRGREMIIQDAIGKRDTQYEIKNKVEPKHVTVFMGQATEQVLAIKSLISATRKYNVSDRFYSPVKRMTEKLVRNQSLAQYQYFTHSEKSENSDIQDDIVKFWGPDVLNGPVHSNDDIWIQNAGGGWPTFHAMVTTAKRIRVWPNGNLAVNSVNMEEIFQGGWAEEVPPILFQPDASELRRNGTPFGNGVDIVYIKMVGTTMQTMFGNIVSQGVQDFDVYSWYPDRPSIANDIVNAGGNWFEDSDHIWTNSIAMYDTIWTNGPSLPISSYGNSYYTPDAEVWIEGVVAGKVTVGSAKRIYIVGDITYANTDVGLPPDDPDNTNTSDFFGLVSEEKMLIRYKHYDPFEEFILRDDNCYDVNLYGAFAALGEGDPDLYGIYNCHYEGIFTFEYQHGHGSTPSFWAMSPYTMVDTLYTYIDLHKFIFPINNYVPPNILGFNLHGNDPISLTQPCGFPYEDPAYQLSFPNNEPYVLPYGTDYPWYNPVWPESSDDIVWERGVLHIWGAIAQRRRGFIHRSGSDPYNHPNNEWKLDDTTFHYDGNHPSCGYDKDYHYDDRFLYIQPPDYPQVYEGWGTGLTAISTFDKRAWGYYSPKEW